MNSIKVSLIVLVAVWFTSVAVADAVRDGASLSGGRVKSCSVNNSDQLKIGSRVVFEAQLQSAVANTKPQSKTSVTTVVAVMVRNLKTKAVVFKETSSSSVRSAYPTTIDTSGVVLENAEAGDYELLLTVLGNVASEPPVLLDFHHCTFVVGP